MAIPRAEDLKTTDKGIILVSVPLIVGTIFILVMTAMLIKAQDQTRVEQHVQDLLFTQNKLETLLADRLAYGAANIFFADENAAERSAQLRKETDALFDKFRTLVQPKQELVKRIDKLQSSSDYALSEVDQINLDAGGEMPAFQLMQLPRFCRKMQQVITLRNSDRKAWLAAFQKENQTDNPSSDQWKLAILVVFLAGLFSTIILSIRGAKFFSQSMSKRLQTLVENSIRFSAGQPLHPRIAGKDEIAQLDSVFHDMAEKVARATRKERALIDNTIDVICSIDPNGRFAAVNPACLEVWGYEPDELLGRRLVDIVDKEDIEPTLAAIQNCQKQKAETTIENKIKHKDGSSVGTLWSIYWSDAQKALFCVAHDITERLIAERYRQESEAKVRLMLQSMPVGLVICNENEEMEIANIAIEQLFGFSEAEIAGKSIRTLFDDLGHEDLMDKVEEYNTGKSVELEARTKNGITFPVELALAELYLSGQPKLLVIIADITSRREVERMKKDFVAMVSHDLRSPLTALVVTLQMMERGSLGEINDKGKARIATIEAEVSRLINLINNLLDIEKLEANRLELSREVTFLELVVKQSLDSVGYLAEKNAITIATEFEETEAFADASALVQVVVNLLANAIKFSPQGSTITVSTKNIPGAVEVAVADQGRGIPASHRETIFDRFKQVEVKDRTEKKGSGLGLSISKAIVEAHGGRIGVDSEEGQGSRFWFSIPVED